MDYRSEFFRLGMRDIRQVKLLSMWEEISGSSSLPLFKDFDLDATSRFQDCMSICKVMRDNDPLEFEILYHGADFKRIYGDGLVGKLVGGMTAPDVRDSTLATYRRVVETRTPSFSNWPFATKNGPVVHYERLLLPFSKRETEVDFILCALTLFSKEGQFSFRDIAGNQLKQGH